MTSGSRKKDLDVALIRCVHPEMATVESTESYISSTTFKLMIVWGIMMKIL